MTEKQFIEGILQGNEEAFKVLVNNYQSLVLNTCNSFLHNRQDAEDLTQEVFIEAFRSISKFRGKSSLSTWLYRIAVNKSLNFIRDNRKNRHMKSLEDPFPCNEDSNDMQVEDTSVQYSDLEKSETEKIELLHISIASLPKNQKVAFTLNKLEDLSYKKISEIMDLSLPSVEGLIHRAKRNVEKKIISHYQKKLK
jgi:RNA polymerase sigma-70 factor, ECF subfamily